MSDKKTEPTVRKVSSTITWANRWDHFLARWGVNRSGHRVEPGLYALGNPAGDSPVFVTANYTLSFDALRSALIGIDGYILALDTEGVNVWCAAGKGTFGTDELVQRIETSGLRDLVNHRVLILPQLSAPGVAAHEAKRRSGFKIEYGPVRATDLPAYLKTRRATPEMRRVRFSLWDRLVLIPVELVHVLLPLALVTLVLRSPAVVAAVLAGVVLFPVLLPWLPTHNFSTKGFILGGAVAVLFAALAWFNHPEVELWRRAAWTLAHLLLLPPVTAYLALNFTGSTTFTSRSGVRREIFAYVPLMAWTFGIGVALNIVLLVVEA